MSVRGATLAELDRSLTRLYERLSAWEETIAEHVGLSPRQCHAVAELGSLGKVRMKALAGALGISTGTLTVMIDRLERRGLVAREADPEDGRAFFLCLSPTGAAVAAEHRKHHEALYEGMRKALGAASSRELVSIMDRLEEIDLEPSADDGRFRAAP